LHAFASSGHHYDGNGVAQSANIVVEGVGRLRSAVENGGRIAAMGAGPGILASLPRGGYFFFEL